ncbi:MAG TPA: hypothetical protein VGG14_03710, partial [Candidatus Sulfotelmatobacter sp.]
MVLRRRGWFGRSLAISLFAAVFGVAGVVSLDAHSSSSAGNQTNDTQVAKAAPVQPSGSTAQAAQAQPAPAPSAQAPAAPAAAGASPPVPPPTFVGAELCSRCHYDKFISYQNIPMSESGNKNTPGAHEGCESCHGPASNHVGGGGGRGVGGLMN